MTSVKRVFVLLAFVLLVAAALRIWGLDYGLPHPLSRPDEERIVGRAQTIFATGNWHPGSFFYPSLLFYLDTAALEGYYGYQRLTGRYERPFDLLFDIAVTKPGLHYLIARSVGAASGILTVLVIFFLGAQVTGNRTAGLIAASLLAVCHLHVRESHFATVDVAMTLFVTASLLFAARAVASPNTTRYALAGLFAGLAASTKYNAGMVVLATLAASYVGYRSSRLSLGAVASRLATAGLVAAAVFAVTSPYVVLRYQGFLADMRGLRAFLYDRPGGLSLWDHLETTLPGGLGWPLFLTVLAGLGHASWRRRPGHLVLLAFVVPYFALVSSVRVTFPRYLVPIVPALIVLAADFLTMAIARYRPAILAAVTLALATPTLLSSIHYDRLAARKDTRLLAAEWIGAHVAPQSQILVCRGYGAPHVNTDRRRPPAFAVREVDCRDVPQGGSYLLTHTHRQLTAFSRISEDIARWLEANGERLAVFDPYREDSETEPYFFGADAFYIPFTGYDAVVRGGPVVEIWKLP